MLGRKTSALVFAITLLISPWAFAQDARNALLEEVVVTATKKNDLENVQTVPIAITAITENQLDALKFKDISDIGFMIPNTNLQPITTKGTAFFNIRGVGPSSSIISHDPAVGVFIDGVYMPTGQGTVFDTFDLESIEVLRGPQGVLFGRNVVGGAVLMNTKKPTDEFEAELTVRTDSRFDDTGSNTTLMGLVRGPLSDNVSYKLAVYYNDDAGWFENEFDGSDFGEAETTVVRGALSWDVTDSVNMLVQYEWFDSDEDGLANQSHDRMSGREFTRPDMSLGIFDKGSHDFSTDLLDSFSETETNSLTWTSTIDVSFGDGTITNIMAWREFDQLLLADIDGTPTPTFNSFGGSDVEHFSNELRYFGTFGNTELTTGLYYLDVEIASESQQALRVSPTLWINRTGGGFQDVDTWGVFANVDHRVRDDVVLTAGIRYTEDEKSAEGHALNNNRTFDAGPVYTPCGFVVSAPVQCPFDLIGEDDWSNVSFKLGATWYVDDATMLYGSISRSFRGGAFNLRRSNIADDQLPVDEEEMDQLELGFKWDVNDRLRLNAAFFVLESNDLQLVTFAPDLSQQFFNAAERRNTGVELDGRFVFNDNWLMTFAFGFNDGEYLSVGADINTDGVVDALDESLDPSGAAKYNGNLGLLYNNTFGNWDFFGQLLYTSRSNITNNSNTSNRGSVDLVDLNLALAPQGSPWEVSLYGRNLTNKAIYTQSTEINLTQGAHLATLAKGRRWGVEFKYSFD